MTSPTFIAPHLREDVYRTYAAYIAYAVDAFPRESSFTIPSTIAPTTFVANFRNAILSLKLYAWECEHMTPALREKLWKLGADKSYAIAADTTGRCWFRLRQRAGRPNLLTAQARTHIDPSSLPEGVVPWRDATEEEISAVCKLLHFKRLSGPIPIEGPVAQEFIDRLTFSLDVSLVYDAEKNLTIIN